MEESLKASDEYAFHSELLKVYLTPSQAENIYGKTNRKFNQEKKLNCPSRIENSAKNKSNSSAQKN